MKTDLRWIRIPGDEAFRAQLDELREDHIPRLIQDEEGDVIGVLIHPDSFAQVTGIPKSRIHQVRLRQLIGSIPDLDADEMIADIRRWRDEAPPSPDPSRYFLDEDEEPEPDSRER